MGPKRKPHFRLIAKVGAPYSRTHIVTALALMMRSSHVFNGRKGEETLVMCKSLF